jgi:hypothetical protein
MLSIGNCYQNLWSQNTQNYLLVHGICRYMVPVGTRCLSVHSGCRYMVPVGTRYLSVYGISYRNFSHIYRNAHFVKVLQIDILCSTKEHFSHAMTWPKEDTRHNWTSISHSTSEEMTQLLADSPCLRKVTSPLYLGIQLVIHSELVENTPTAYIWAYRIKSYIGH